MQNFQIERDSALRCYEFYNEDETVKDCRGVVAYGIVVGEEEVGVRPLDKLLLTDSFLRFLLKSAVVKDRRYQ